MIEHGINNEHLILIIHIKVVFFISPTASRGTCEGIFSGHRLDLISRQYSFWIVVEPFIVLVCWFRFRIAPVIKMKKIRLAA